MPRRFQNASKKMASKIKMKGNTNSLSWFKTPTELKSRNEPFSFQKHLMSFSIARCFSLRSGQIKWTGFDEILHKGSLCQDASKTLVKKMGVVDPIFPENELKASRVSLNVRVLRATRWILSQ